MMYHLLLGVALLSSAPASATPAAALNAPFSAINRLAPPPAAVQAAFSKRFPKATAVKWEKEDAGWEAEFHEGKEEVSVEFNADGTLREIEREVALTALPAPVLPYVQKNYPSAKIKEAARLEDAAGTVTWEAEVGGKDLIFDAAGTFLRIQ